MVAPGRFELPSAAPKAAMLDHCAALALKRIYTTGLPLEL